MSWFGKFKSKKSRNGKSRIVKTRGSSAEKIIKWSRRLGIIAAVVIFIGWLASWFFMSGASTKLYDWAHDQVMAMTAERGFIVQNIYVEGRQYTDAETLMAILNVEKGDPLFTFAPDEAKEMIEKISWVKSAHVSRQLPNSIFIELEERTPMALWQRNKQLSLIDTHGVILTDKNLGDFKDYIVVVGVDVPERAPDFMKLLAAEPEILNKIEAAKSISGRRWDITLKSGAVVKLPENEIPLALRRLAKMQEEENIMDKDISVIDVREMTRITVRTKPGAVHEYRANFNADSGNQI